MQYRKSLLGFLIWFSLAVGIVSTGSLISLIGEPFPGFTMFYHDQERHWYVDNNPVWWPSVANGEFINAAKILTIEGVAGDMRVIDFTSMYRQAYQEKGYIDLITESWDIEIEHRIPLQIFTWSHFFDIKSYDLVVGLGFWLLALALYRAYRDDTVIFIFIFACLALVIARWNWVGVGFYSNQLVLRMLRLVYLELSSSLAAPLVTHLALLFPTRVRFYRPAILWTIYFVYVAIFITAILSNEALSYNIVNDQTLFLNRFSSRSTHYFNLLATVTLLLRIIYEVVWCKTRRIRTMTRLLLIGFVPTLFYVVPHFLNRLGFINFDPVTAWIDMRYLYLSLPSVAGLVILRYRAFQRVNYLFLLVPALGLSALAASLATGLLQHLPESGAVPIEQAAITFFVLFLFIFSVAALFLYHSSWQGFFGRILQWDKYNLNDLQQFTQSLIQQPIPAKMAQTIVNALVDELDLTHAVIWLGKDESGLHTLSAFSGNLVQFPQRFTVSDKESQQFFDGKPQYVVDVLNFGFKRPFAQLNENDVIIPILLDSQLLGLIDIGPRWDEEVFDNQDLLVLGLLGQQAAQFILTARHMAELQAIPRTIASAQENERFRLAQELHDSTQQLLGRLPFYLETSRNIMSNDPEEADRLIQVCIQDIVREAKNVRAIRNSLAPTRLASGLIQPLQSLVDRYMQRFGIVIELEFFPKLDKLTSEEFRHAIYRVIQQALDNVVQHAEANRVWIYFTNLEDRIVFQIDDDGLGFEISRLQAAISSRFGIKSMKARMEMLDGGLDISSRTPCGTSVYGWLKKP